MLQTLLKRVAPYALIAAISVAGAPPAAQAQSVKEIDALNEKVNRLYGEGKYKEAIPIAERTLKASERGLGREHPYTLTSVGNLALLYRAQGHYSEAEPLYKRVLEVRERVLGKEHPDTLRSVGNLAGFYRGQGRYGEAEPLYKRALGGHERVLGNDHPDTLTSVHNLAVLYQDQGRYREAEPLYKRALEGHERVLGKKHPDTLTSVFSLGVLYEKQGRYGEAEPLLKRALEARERVLGKEHPDTLSSVNSLAWHYQLQGRYSEAEPLFKRALETSERALGKEHPHTLISVDNLALLYRTQGRYREAEPLYMRALEALERVLGKEHPDTLTCVGSLAELYRTQGRYGEAEPLYKRVLEVREQVLGKEHPDTLLSVNNLAVLYHAQGRYGEAEPLYERALEAQERVLGKEHPDTLTSVNNLAGLYETQGRYGEAEPLHTRALEVRERVLGEEHPDTLASLHNLATVYFKEGDWARAASFWRRSTAALAQRTLRDAGGPDDALTGKKRGEAEQFYWQFENLIKAAHRLAKVGGEPDTRALGEMFQTAQWVYSSEAARALALMAARGAKGDPELERLTKERQDLAEEWQQRDAQRNTALGQPAERRSAEAEAENAARLAAIDARIAGIDKRLKADFQNYAALANPKPLSVEDVQALLGTDEALVLLLDTPEAKPTPEETFIWVITKTDRRWARSDLGTAPLAREVQALRCGLDAAEWRTPQDDVSDTPEERQQKAERRARAEACFAALGRAPEDPDGQAVLPFDLARAHRLYMALFGEIEQLLADKRHLLIVPSGALTQLPFHVLVTRPAEATPEPLPQGWLGISFQDLDDQQANGDTSMPAHGVAVTSVLETAPAAAAGLQTGDVIASVDGVNIENGGQFAALIQNKLPKSTISLKIHRNGEMRTISAILGGRETPSKLFLDPARHKSVDWLARKYAITVLPAVPSLKALRGTSRPSAAAKPLIGFGNPLVDGPDSRYIERARLARERQNCPRTAWERVDALFNLRGGVPPVETPGGLVKLSDIQMKTPLPETADELCAVARDAGTDLREIRLGAHATEREVKTLSRRGDLAQYRVVLFATHGEMAGQLKASAEPGLVLTPPTEASEEDDGYLSASEIAGMKFDADWVILSACNTAAGGAGSAEALSGLARAFFYAQGRALLVSHWEVDSATAVKLITSTMRQIANGRAEALRRAMQAFFDGTGTRQAHPAYWAPFIVVGEGGAIR